MSHTTIVGLVCLGVIAVWDIVKVCKGEHDTLSRVWWDGSRKYPWIGLLTGYILGHLFPFGIKNY